MDEARRQLALFTNPPAAANLVRPCTIGDGVVRLEPEQHPELIARWKAAAKAGRLSKFVPASGAATRMFEKLETEEGKRIFLEGKEKFAFLGNPDAACHGAGTEQPTNPITFKEISGGSLSRLLSLPKALIPFHRYGSEVRTPFEEHLVEAADVVRDGGGVCRVHFTISPEHEPAFRALLDRARPTLERDLGVSFDVTFSFQRPSTDTIAVDPENRPFRLDDGKLLFRPGGHGALLANLEALGGDVVFIKNIDNVQWGPRAATGFYWKKLLAGFLLSLEGEARDEGRPVRVAGVVRNEGEPGGGPFWVQGPGGRETPQIVESAQVDSSLPSQNAIWKSSTHFNPVDLVVSLRDAAREAYRLGDFVDENTVFIAKKSKDGRALKALERPGLWNGAMARWKTVFVEIPGETFTPVKTVFDLLRPEHQP